MTDLEMTKRLRTTLAEWTKARIGLTGALLLMTIALVSPVGLDSFGSNPSAANSLITRSMAHAAVPVSLPAARAAAPITDAFGIRITTERNSPVDNASISKNPEVNLTPEQASVVKAFGAYLASRGEWAIVTSGKRTSEGQLALIKERIAEKGATRKFPQLEEASVLDTKIWLKAWHWLTARRVPINAPAPVPGANVRTSMHLKGLAIDFISDDLSHLRTLLANFSRSSFARNADLQIVGIVREPGCVHINLG
ncbi:MAG: hypothetical protein Q8922_06485 [Bacteroidota bacterium]|nr:hypothetical protein [Bacteroidota bacterium]MDP4233806.1 hypothetical protein [Bacteroidota bacterium]MDP4242445.1 hypothetical protein [Bacteroidota bacterium]MDP4287567.1 hypothetical protein [Bacteroidota bacterium]